MKYLLIFILLLFVVTGCSSNKLTTPEPLNEEDFTITYKSFEINGDTEVEEIENSLGYGRDFEINNNGFISSGIGSVRWQAVYPNYDEAELRTVFLTTSSETYLVFVELNKLATKRGIRVGDSYEILLEKYGEPKRIFEPCENHETYRYTLNEKYIDFVFDTLSKTIQYIMIDYRSYKADKEQIFLEE